MCREKSPFTTITKSVNVLIIRVKKIYKAVEVYSLVINTYTYGSPWTLFRHCKMVSAN